MQENTEKILIKQGAESIVYKTLFLTGIICLLKVRPAKLYRHPLLDERLTKHRINIEARLLYKCYRGGVSCPSIYFVDIKKRELWIEWIEGKTVRDQLIQWESNIGMYEQVYKPIMESIGRNIGLMHQLDVVHGDLTTSNIMIRLQSSQELFLPMTESVKSNEAVIIDFGLGCVTQMIENKAVDLYVLERTFQSTHPQCSFMFKYIIDAYSETCKNAKQVLKRLEEVRLRGRKRNLVG
ncbi:Kae1-associated kinase Bud32 [Pneumocystis carinii B80]|uniref:non-specific serine/threonine protein kinase n=1 Tax=Pneumocystis carinii (strain B80) TaxID=1408658 RepID=A0A0W4ZM01_PNEC8|nr:Kae1-associated kinase Bud32 [Pneumocystis carinii B80]KTW29404.1 Kae1-associated kinase Bud32 [Pneumocystis carinii B80]